MLQEGACQVIHPFGAGRWCGAFVRRLHHGGFEMGRGPPSIVGLPGEEGGGRCFVPSCETDELAGIDVFSRGSVVEGDAGGCGAAGRLRALLALNNAHHEALSLLDGGRLGRMLGSAYFAARFGEADALMIAFDEGAAYDSLNFLWFRARYARFVYVDRVVVAATARRRGLAGRLYAALERRALEDGHEVMTCEVNLEPPNPGSDAFHAGLGFGEVGRADAAGGKVVRYLARRLSA